MSPYPSFTQQILLLQGQHSWMTLHLHCSYHPVHHSSFLAEIYAWLLGSTVQSLITSLSLQASKALRILS